MRVVPWDSIEAAGGVQQPRWQKSVERSARQNVNRWRAAITETTNPARDAGDYAGDTMSKSINSRIERLATLLMDQPHVRITLADFARPASSPPEPPPSTPSPAPVSAPEPKEPAVRCPECRRAVRDCLPESVPTHKQEIR